MVDSVVVAVMTPNTFLEVKNKHCLELSTMWVAAFEAGFLEINLAFNRCKDAPFGASFWDVINVELYSLYT